MLASILHASQGNDETGMSQLPPLKDSVANFAGFILAFTSLQLLIPKVQRPTSRLPDLDNKICRQGLVTLIDKDQKQRRGDLYGLVCGQ